MPPKASGDLEACRPQTLRLFAENPGKLEHVRSFVESQRKLVQSRTGHFNPPSPSKTPPPQEGDTRPCGFGTPVLKPRAPEASSTTQPPTAKAHLPSTRTAQRKVTEKSSEKENVKQGKPSTKRSKPVKDHDTEHSARLAERRERKRIKREITRPKQKDDSDKPPTDHSLSPGKQAGIKNGRKTKIPPGLAIMHTFSAGNLSKNRLTLRPEAAIGFFNKGKASEKTNVLKGKKRTRNKPEYQTFCETKFLNHKASTAVRQRSASVDSLSGQSESSTSISNADPEEQIPAKAALDQIPKQPTASIGPDPAQSATGESQVWEIEREFLDRLPSDCVNLDAQSNGTVVLNTNVAPWAQVKGSLDQLEDVTQLHEEPTIARISQGDQLPAMSAEFRHQDEGEFSSLAPSDSASQNGLHYSHQSCVLKETSKYFAGITVQQDFEVKDVNMADPTLTPDLSREKQAVFADPRKSSTEEVRLGNETMQIAPQTAKSNFTSPQTPGRLECSVLPVTQLACVDTDDAPCDFCPSPIQVIDPMDIAIHNLDPGDTAFPSRAVRGTVGQDSSLEGFFDSICDCEDYPYIPRTSPDYAYGEGNFYNILEEPLDAWHPVEDGTQTDMDQTYPSYDHGAGQAEVYPSDYQQPYPSVDWEEHSQISYEQQEPECESSHSDYLDCSDSPVSWDGPVSCPAHDPGIHERCDAELCMECSSDISGEDCYSDVENTVAEEGSFMEGRALLLGIPNPATFGHRVERHQSSISKAEAEVAKTFRSTTYWLPQKL